MQACLAGQALLFSTGVWIVTLTPPREAETSVFRLLFILSRRIPYNRGVRSLEDYHFPCRN